MTEDHDSFLAEWQKQQILQKQQECTRPNVAFTSSNVELEIKKCAACNDNFVLEGFPRCAKGDKFCSDHASFKQKLIAIIQKQEAEMAAQPKIERLEEVEHNLSRLQNYSNENAQKLASTEETLKNLDETLDQALTRKEQSKKPKATGLSH
jgi:uncharacterized Zn finger protein (UPF0148 family)